MLNIGQFFKKIQNKYSKELFVRSTIQEVIQNQCGVNVPAEAMSFSGSALILKGVSQVARSQIFIKKQTILQQINERQSVRVVVEIR